ncbi:MAG: aminodeoxychorismate/anthranilate synthase component II, partial [Bacteroidetes bacterium]
MRVLVFDNYDSFTYNLVHMVEYLTGTAVDVYRNDAISLDAVAAYDKIILSPGPGVPSEAGLLLPLIEAYAATKSILGVCLGHQAIGQAFGAGLTNLSKVYHGVATPITLVPLAPVAGLAPAPSGLYANMPHSFSVGRYHSWVVDAHQLPNCLSITATDADGLIMGLRHQQYDVEGV